MTSSPEFMRPLVPEQVDHYLDDAHVQDTLERWQQAELEPTLASMPAVKSMRLDDDRRVGYVDLHPAAGPTTDEVIVLPLPHQQAWKPSMFVRAELMRQILAPQGRVIAFPNNSREAENYYTFTRPEQRKLAKGDISPLSELQVRVLEKLQLSRISVTGYSLGGLSALGIASVGSPQLEITHVNSDEMPYSFRKLPQLKKDFLKSGGWGDQRAAIADAALPVLSEVFSRRNMGRDYANFGLSTFIGENADLLNMMAGSKLGLLDKALEANPQANIKVGRVVGSLLFGAGFPTYPGKVSDVEYTGEGSHMHATGDNPVAHALMAKDGLG